MAEEKNQNNSICTETESSMVINSAEESANQKFEQTQGSQHHHIKEEYDLDLPLNLSSIETHIPLEATSPSIVDAVDETKKAWFVKPIAFQTGDLTMKISKSAVSSHYQQAHKKTLSKQKVRLLTTKKIARKISPNVVAEKPSDMCSVCKADFDINASVYCLKTGEAKIVCRQCTTVTIMRGAFKVPKHLHS